MFYKRCIAYRLEVQSFSDNHFCSFYMPKYRDPLLILLFFSLGCILKGARDHVYFTIEFTVEFQAMILPKLSIPWGSYLNHLWYNTRSWVCAICNFLCLKNIDLVTHSIIIVIGNLVKNVGWDIDLTLF